MHRKTAVILVLALAVLAGERKAVVLCLKKAPGVKVKVWATEVTEEGMQIEYLGTAKRAFVKWEDLVEDDARRIRLAYKLDMTEDEKKGLMVADEVFFKGGARVIGLVIKQDPDKNEFYVRTDGMVLAYPLDRLDRIEKTKVPETEIYDEDEIYLQRLERHPPTNWGDHRRLAAHMYEIGNYRKAQEHYLEAVRLRPALHEEVDPRLAEIKDILDDEGALEVIQKAKSLANLWGRYDDAKALLEAYAESRPGSQRRVILVIEEIDDIRVRKVTVRFHRVKAREADKSIRQYLLRKQPTLEEARSWITTGFKQDLEARLAGKMGMSKDEIEQFKKTRTTGAAHWTSYGAGSFVIDPRAKKGKSTDKDVRGDPEEWWRSYGDVTGRSAWMRAMAAESLPDLFEVVQIRRTPCPSCGGTGQVKKSSVNGLKALGGGHDWRETCPRCYGAAEDRGIAYR